MTAFHKAARVEAVGDICFATVNSYVDFNQYVSGAPITWQDQHAIPLEEITGNPIASAEHWLITNGAFVGGAIVTDVTDLETAKVRQWMKLKAARDSVEWSGFDVPDLGRFDSDTVSQSKIIGATLAAQLAEGAGIPYAIDWTLQNNDVVTLDRAAMDTVGFALMAHLNAIHQRGRLIREAITAATTVDAVTGISWDSVL